MNDTETIEESKDVDEVVTALREAIQASGAVLNRSAFIAGAILWASDRVIEALRREIRNLRQELAAASRPERKREAKRPPASGGGIAPPAPPAAGHRHKYDEDGICKVNVDTRAGFFTACAALSRAGKKKAAQQELPGATGGGSP